MLNPGDKVPGFENLTGTDQQSYSLSSFDDRNILVFVFMGTGCPTCKATEERLISIQNDYASKGVQLVLVNSNNASISPPDTLEEMTRRSKDAMYNFPYLKDEGGSFARTLGAKTTPHAFVVDIDRKLRYKGRVDNARQKSMITAHELRDVLDDLIAGRQVKAPVNESFGCAIIS